jgi:SAM-dependent methyltransferase
MKDNFSAQATYYRAFRPNYPPELYEFVLGQVEGRDLAWDCGTGNGQVAGELARHFARVYATDISAAQLSEATELPNVQYALRPAEESGQEPRSVDLITAGQALHWFPFTAFYDEVRRVLKPGGLFAAWGYQLFVTNVEALNEQIRHFYAAVVGPYWDAERHHVDQAYTSIPFPFEEIECPLFSIHLQWSIDELEGYLHTWSSVQHYIRAHQQDPVATLMPQLRPLVADGQLLDVHFPVFMRAGRLRVEAP